MHRSMTIPNRTHKPALNDDRIFCKISPRLAQSTGKTFHIQGIYQYETHTEPVKNIDLTKAERVSNMFNPRSRLLPPLF
jgi:hypothetical protein